VALAALHNNPDFLREFNKQLVISTRESSLCDVSPNYKSKEESDNSHLAGVNALAETLETLLQPFARMLVRRGIGARTTTEIAKRAYVAAAMDVLREQNLPVTSARLSVFTGLTQREVEQAQAELAGSQESRAANVTELAGLLTAWHEDSRYSIAFTGTPAELDFDGPPDRPTFTRLVRESAPGQSPKELLAFLVSSGVARINEESGRIQAVSRAFISEPYSAAAGKRFERMIRNLIETFYSNFETPDTEKRRFNRNAIADFSLHKGAEEEFRQHVQLEGQRFLESLDKWLQSQAPGPDEGRRVGVAIFHFVEQREAGEGMTPKAQSEQKQLPQTDSSPRDSDSNQDIIDVLNYQGPKS
jgi:hypothetical protein